MATGSLYGKDGDGDHSPYVLNAVGHEILKVNGGTAERERKYLDGGAGGFRVKHSVKNWPDEESRQGLANARNVEALFEICYTAKLNPGWTFQPDFQYILQPGGGISEPSSKGTVQNAAVWGIRTTINF